MAYEGPSGRVQRAFAAELRARGVDFVAAGENRLSVTPAGGRRRIISLANITRELTRDGFDLSRLRAWLDVALSDPSEISEWPHIRDLLRWHAEPSDLEVGDAYRLSVSPRMSRYLVSVDTDEARIGFIASDEIRQWAAGPERVMAVAAKNLDAVLERAEVRTKEADGHQLGFFETASVSKASLIFAPSLALKVAPFLGWPVLAVAPARDFLLLFAEASAAHLVPRLGPVVKREYTQSGYPLTPELLRIGDEGVEAVGSYDAQPLLS